ncbi:hypothetical protein ACFQPF_09465 [Fictibacillus iocasae]|uniref:Uncharacterized protein n=1 Tax=Fictibacillus iocasae TaxID=2715437 RepID=A0ABW2NQP7_9BACL
MARKEWKTEHKPPERCSSRAHSEENGVQSLYGAKNRLNGAQSIGTGVNFI